jgi:hypothetical protein
MDLEHESAKVKVFAWLFFKDRLSTKANLLHKHVMEDSVCQRCSHPVEDRQHVFFDCPLSSEIWDCIGLSSVPTMDTGYLVVAVDSWFGSSSLALYPPGDSLAYLGRPKWDYFQK